MQENFISDLLKKPAWMLFIISWLFYLGSLFLYCQMVWDTNTYLSDFKGTDFETVLSNCRKMDMIRYVLSPVWVLAISFFIWLLIKAGLFVKQIEFSNMQLFKIVFLGFILISMSSWVKSVWLILFQSGYTTNEAKYFFPDSIVTLIDTTGMNETKIKALAHINLFQLAFVVFTGWQLATNSTLKFINSIVLVLCTYGLFFTLLELFKVQIFS